MIRICLLVVLFTAQLCTQAPAETAEEKGYRIAQAASERGRGYQSSVTTGEMVLKDRQGVTSVRRFRTMALEVKGKGDRYIFVFELPRDIAGTAVLTHTHRNKQNDQWLYLPELKRVKRISSGAKTSPFAGSEFSYEDLSAPGLDRFSYRWLRDEACPGQKKLACHVIDRFPKDRSSGYARETVWMDRDKYRIFRVDFFSRGNTHIKTLIAGTYRLYEKKFWLADTVTMTNLRNGKSSTMTWSNRDFSVNLKVNNFSPRAMRRIR